MQLGEFPQVGHRIQRRFGGFGAATTNGANVLVAPTVPLFAESTGVVTIPTKTGVVYKNDDTNATLTARPSS